MIVEIQNQTPEKIDVEALEEKVHTIFRELAEAGVEMDSDKEELVIVFVGETEGARLNEEFRDKEGATDVLSFEPIEPTSLGELAICIPVIQKQAPEHGVTFDEEIIYMILHGILHLLGYDHEEDEAQAKEMYSLQDDVFEKVR